MKETETYTKVHDFLYDLDLPDVALRVFAFIFTVIVHANAQNVWGTKYIADHTHLSTRSVKQALRCLRGIGLVRVNGRAANGANVYVPKVSDCHTTTEARHRLVHSVHRCTTFTGEHQSPERCAQCTYGGEYRSPQISIENINIKCDERKNAVVYKPTDREPPVQFRGSDTIEIE